GIATVAAVVTSLFGESVLASGSGTTLAWGDNSSGQLGGGPGPLLPAPGASSALVGIKAVAAGAAHTLALMEDGTVRAWGANERGQLGDGTRTSRAPPVTVSGLSAVVAIAAGYSHNLALTQEGTVFSWGDGTSGQLGNGYPATTYPSGEGCTILLIFPCLDSSGTGTDSSEAYPDEGEAVLTQPRPVRTHLGPLRNVTAIAAGGAHSLAVRDDGTVWAWGSNAEGQLGAGVQAFFNGPILPIPVPVGGNTSREDRLNGITAVAAGGAHSLALAADGSLYSWGANGSGQLGSAEGVSDGIRVTPGSVALGSVAAIAAGHAHTLALVKGLVLGWGDNSRGQLGDGSTDNRMAPIHVAGVPSGGGFGGSNAIGIAAGHFHSLALVDHAPVAVCGSSSSLFGCPGVIFAWGYGELGQLGSGGLSDSAVPLHIRGLTDVTVMAAGAGHSVALDGKLPTQLIFPLEPTPGIMVAPNRPALPPVFVLPPPPPTPTPATLGPFKLFATPTPTRSP
ncbi:MAG TPA: hypothetical protein VNM48_18830, partial [Chloroflexota bacterium]|nr:hypothetical protein [Chloroflexota bacterium]